MNWHSYDGTFLHIAMGIFATASNPEFGRWMFLEDNHSKRSIKKGKQNKPMSGILGHILCDIFILPGQNFRCFCLGYEQMDKTGLNDMDAILQTTFQNTFLNGNYCILMKVPLKIDDILELVLVMAWRRTTITRALIQYKDDILPV